MLIDKKSPLCEKILWTARAAADKHCDRKLLRLLHVEATCMVATNGKRLHRCDLSDGELAEGDYEVKKIREGVELTPCNEGTYPNWRMAIPESSYLVVLGECGSDPMNFHISRAINLLSKVGCWHYKDFETTMDRVEGKWQVLASSPEDAANIPSGMATANPCKLICGDRIAVIMPMYQGKK
jgi:hypothetical protein